MQTFWHLLKAGKKAIREIPPERWDWRRYFQAEKGATCGANPGQAQGTGSAQGTIPTIYTKWGGFLEDIESFDAPFFHISPRDAEQMDPQERLFLEVSYACIEDAGYTPAGLQEDGPVGVFVGVMNGNYPTGTRYWSIANRVSFVLGLQGPSVAIDTACSSSLTALHFAVESLISGTCACAIVGGVNLIVDPVHYERLSQLGMLSASDQCKSFGEDADGFVDGEGVGAILLKPLQRAEADGDHIYSVIKATAINHGGKTNGYTVPNPQAQSEVIGRALKDAGIDPRTISYIEAHGTGTVLGDPIEIAGLTRAFGKGTQDKQYCAIGSVKSNIGHAESAAGIAGVTKVLLQMRYGQLVPSLHAQVLNPHIDFSATPFVVQRELTEWKRPQVLGVGEGEEVPRCAGVSSFGAGGSNAHVILEEYVERQQGRSHWSGAVGVGLAPACDPTSPDEGLKSVGAGPAPAQRSRPALIVLSARTQEQLHEQVQQLLAWIQDSSLWACPTGAEEPLGLHNLAYTLQVGREAMEERLALQVGSLQELEEKLRKYVEGAREGGDWYRGQVKRHDAIDIFAADEDGQKTIAAWMSKGKYGKLLSWWVRGGTIDWKYLYGEHLPRRISLPTYPFARKRYWFSIEARRDGACPRPMATLQPEAEDRALAPTINTNGNGKASDYRDKPDGYKRVVLRPLGNPVLSSRGSGLSLPTSSAGVDQPQPSVTPSRSAQSFSQARSNAVEAPGRPAEPGTQATTPGVIGARPMATTNMQTPLLAVDLGPAPKLEEELARSLANVLHMEQSDIDVETPFVDMGLDSVSSVEWMRFLNQQYAINLGAGCVYDYPTVRQMTDFLEKDLLKHEGGIQQTPVQSMSTLSLDDVLQQVRQGTLDTEKAKQLLQWFPADNNRRLA
jgi:acyl transferase domain-containing protein/acyl carrier protein